MIRPNQTRIAPLASAAPAPTPPADGHVGSAPQREVTERDLRKLFLEGSKPLETGLNKLVSESPKVSVPTHGRHHLVEGARTLLVDREGRTLHGLDVQTGEKLWSHTEGDGPGGCVRAFDVSSKHGLVALTDGSRSTGIRLLDSQTGALEHTLSVPVKDWNAGENSLEFSGDRLVAEFGTGGERCHVLVYDMKSPEAAPKQAELPSRSLKTAFSPNGETLFAAGTYESKLYALDLETGQPRWEKRFQNADDPLVGPDGSLYLKTWTGVKALDPASGDERWSQGGPDTSAFLRPDGTLMLRDGHRLSAWQPDGARIWEAPDLGGSYSRPVQAENLLYATVTGKSRGFEKSAQRLVVLDSQTGQVMAQSEPLPGKGASFYQDSGNVYLRVGDEITRFNPSDLGLSGLEDRALGEPAKPSTIQMGNGFVSVGGVRLKSRKA